MIPPEKRAILRMNPVVRLTGWEVTKESKLLISDFDVIENLLQFPVLGSPRQLPFVDLKAFEGFKFNVEELNDSSSVQVKVEEEKPLLAEENEKLLAEKIAKQKLETIAMAKIAKQKIAMEKIAKQRIVMEEKIAKQKLEEKIFYEQFLQKQAQTQAHRRKVRILLYFVYFSFGL